MMMVMMITLSCNGGKKEEDIHVWILTQRSEEGRRRIKEGRLEHIIVEEEQRDIHILIYEYAVSNVAEKKYYGCHQSRVELSTVETRIHCGAVYVCCSLEVWRGLAAQLANCEQKKHGKLRTTGRKLIEGEGGTERWYQYVKSSCWK